MKTLIVKEKIRIRVRYGEDGWGEWLETTNDFDTACQYAQEQVRENGWATWQVAKFYYDLDDNYIAWDSGIVIGF